MRQKFTVAIDGMRKRLRLSEQIYVPFGYIVSVDSVSVNWDYENVPTGTDLKLGADGLTVHPNPVTKTLGPGYATFNDVVGFMAPNNLVLTALPVTGKCKLSNNNAGTLTLSDNLKLLLGFENGEFLLNTERESDHRVDFRRGLRYAKVHCSIVDDTKCYSEWDGYTSRDKTIATIPLPTGPLAGVTQHVYTVGEDAPASPGSVENMELYVTDQDGNPISIGLVVISFTISRQAC